MVDDTTTANETDESNQLRPAPRSPGRPASERLGLLRAGTAQVLAQEKKRLSSSMQYLRKGASITFHLAEIRLGGRRIGPSVLHYSKTRHRVIPITRAHHTCISMI